MQMQTILITGCSSGIGLQAASTLKDRGHRVFATARQSADVDKLTALGFESLLCDMQNSKSIQSAVQTLLAKTGGTLDVLFNNAGYVQPGAIEDLSRDMIRDQFETNVFGPMELIRTVLPVMRAQGHGRIIQNTSILGVVAMPFRGAYNASKFALEGFSHTLRQELSDSPIYVSIISPGPINTRIQDNARTIFSATLADQTVVHQKTYQRMQNTFVSPKTWFALNADSVVTQLVHAVESPRPKARYYIGLAAKLFALCQRLLPLKLVDKIAIRASH
jgi:NAD(P)-dependent dehydrogenase (short-subunit alcohol dehydrogenase family)